MDVFARVLLKVRASDTDAFFLAVYVDKKLAFFPLSVSQTAKFDKLLEGLGKSNFYG